MNTRDTGKYTEELASIFLELKGLKIIEKNFRTRYGEIDIVAQDGHTTVIVEVRSREIKDGVNPIETVNHRKQQKIIKTALTYLAHKKLLDTSFRIDILGIVLSPNVEYQWIKNAVLNDEY